MVNRRVLRARGRRLRGNMARSRKSGGALIGLLLLLGLPIWMFQHYPIISIVLVVAFVGGLILYAKSRSCEICGISLKRVTYRWEIGGAKKRVCPNCNRTLERRQSHRALVDM